MEDLEIPQYFICPISLQIMRDPVTTITGMTYDRESIEHWLFKSNNTTCPATQLPLPGNSDLTPNHTLRRLIQSWCTQNSIDRIPSPKPPLDKFYVISLLKKLTHPNSQLPTLRKLESFLVENERNRRCMIEAKVDKAMITFIVTCHKNAQIIGLEEALSIICLTRGSPDMDDIDQLIVAVTWILGLQIDNHVTVTIKNHALTLLKHTVWNGNSNLMSRLDFEFCDKIVSVTREGIVTQQGINAALHVMLGACHWGRNRTMLVEAGAVFHLVELEMGSPEKRTTELVLAVLFHLCSTADGRAELLSHAGGVAVVTKRLLTVSPAASDRALLIIWLISKYSGTSVAVQEMLRVGTVSKLCMVLQVNCVECLKEKAREILRAHSDAWRNSPCIESSFLTKYTG